MKNRKHDIEKYLRGELSPAEMHALEKEALNDPFLAEALEGIEQAGTENFLYDLHQINRSVHDRMRRKPRKDNKTIRIWGWTSAVAATVLLIAVSGFLVVHILRDQQKHNQPVSKAAQPADSAAVGDTIQAKENETGPLAMAEQKEKTPDALPRQVAPSKKDRSAPAPQLSQAGEDANATREEIVVPPPVHEESTHRLDASAQNERIDTDERETSNQPATTARVAEADAVSKKLADRTDAMKKSAPLALRTVPEATRVIKGRVTDESGQGIPGANVAVKGTPSGTTTNAQGEYELRLNDDSTILVFDFIGYESKEVAVRGNNNVSVTLEPDITTLSEVVTTGYGVKREADNTFQSALPEGGKTSFKNYLSTAIRYPQEAITNKTEGRVVVRFTVEPTGQLTDFEVVKGIGSGCEEELIRAIRQGPDWKPGTKDGKPVPDTVKVTFRFQLK